MSNISKEQKIAKKTLSNITELHDLVNNDLLDAYKTIRDMSKDTTIPASVRKSAAQEILRMGWIFAEASDKVLPETDNRERKREREIAGTVTPMFSMKSKNS